ncbi:MAG: exonuclease SbcCD subunit D [Clostridia bacterium]|nr:exonuclease SbcCD subunit D [Clostridia bacterium]
MKLLHLSDLHLGKRVFELSMLEEQRHMLAQALELARQADATLIAGDIYDRQVPPAEAVALFDSFLTRMSEQGSPVLFIAGNHDSAERMAFGSRLMNASGVYAAPVYDGRARRVELNDEYGPVHVYLLPFVKPVHVRVALGDERIEGYTAALEAAIRAMEVDPEARNVLVAHQFVTGGERSESEEIMVGGLDNVDAQVFAPFDYVALGHLHAAQSLCGGRVRYSGAPLPYAFSEAGREKGALMVTLGPKGEWDVRPCPFTPLRRMRRLRGTFDELARGEASEDYIQITLTDEDDIPDAAARLTAVYPNLLQLLYDNARTRAAAADFSRAALMRREPLELFAELYEKQNGAPMDESRRAYLSGVIERIWEGEA